MARVTGQGGYVAAQGFGTAGADARIDNKSWVLVTETDIDDTSDSGTGIWRQGTPVLSKVTSLEVTIWDDDSQYYDVIGVTEGVTLNIYLRRGTAAYFYLITSTTVKTVRDNNENEHVRGVTLTFEFGYLIRNSSAPTLG
jgi:hypothetical protein